MKLSCHSTSEFPVHSEYSRDKDDMLFANVFLTSLSARTSALYSVGPPGPARLTEQLVIFSGFINV